MILRKAKIKCPILGKNVTIRECLSCSSCLPRPILEKLFEGLESEPNRYGVTELVHPCLRRSYFARKQERSYSLQDLYVLNRGRAFHSWFNEFFHMNEVKLFKQFKHFAIVGVIDAIQPTRDGITLFEIKSVNKLPKVPYEHHRLQIQAYYSLARETLQIDKLVLVYLSMNDFAVFQVEKRNIMSYLYQRAKKLHFALKRNKPPKIEDTSLCYFCPFKGICQLTHDVETFKNSQYQN